MNIEILTLFPEMMEQIFSFSIVKRAREKELVNIHCHQIRNFADNKHGSVDDYPYGGGCGMVMTPQPIFDAHEYVLHNNNRIKSEVRTIYCTPKGRMFNQKLALELAEEESLIFLNPLHHQYTDMVLKLLLLQQLVQIDILVQPHRSMQYVLCHCSTRYFHRQMHSFFHLLFRAFQ